MDGGAWKAAVHGVAEVQAGLNDFTLAFHFHAWEEENGILLASLLLASLPMIWVSVCPSASLFCPFLCPHFCLSPADYPGSVCVRRCVCAHPGSVSVCRGVCAHLGSVCVHRGVCAHVRLCTTPWMAAHQAPPSLSIAFICKDPPQSLLFSHSVISDSLRPHGL